MSDVTPTLLDAAFKGYRTVYDEAFDKQMTWSEPLFETITSEAAEEIYGFLDRVPKLRKWLGARHVENLIAQAYRLPNDTFELTVGVKRTDIEDDRIGLYNGRVRRMGQQSKKWPDHLAKATLQGGKVGACFDGKPFFAANHFISYGKKSGSQANLFTSKALTFDNFVDVKQTMMGLLGGDGEPLEDFGEDLVLIVPPALEDKAKSIVVAETIVRSTTIGAVTNTERGSARVQVVAALSNEPTVWYLADVSGEKPFIFQQRYAPDFVPLYNPDSPNVFELDEYRMGTRARGATGYALWWKCARCEA